MATLRYRRMRAAHLGAVQAALEDHVTRLDWSREQITRYRDQRLRALFAYARERSPFFARRLVDLDPLSASVADLASLPMMTKRDVQDEWDAIVTARDITRDSAERILAEQQGFSYTPGDQQVFSSGGSSGVRGVYVWGWQFFVSVACLAWRMQAREERRAAPQSRKLLAVLEAGTPPHASTPLFDVPTAAGMDTVVIEAAAPFDDVLAAVSDARPTHLVGYASVIGRLARAELAGQLELHPVRVSTNSEPLLDEDRQAIREAWNVSVHNLWGSTEIGVQAVGCGRGEGLHVCEDEVVLERVDENGVPVGPDEPAARTLATGLANLTFPFIRYDLGDQVTWLRSPCECGSAFARVADIGGRRDDDFRYGTATVPASVFRFVLGTDPRVSEYQVTQTVSGAEIFVVGMPDVDALSTSLVTALQRHGFGRAADRDPRRRGNSPPSGKRKAAAVHRAGGRVRRPRRGLNLLLWENNHHWDPAVGSSLVHGVRGVFGVRGLPRTLAFGAFSFVRNACDLAAVRDDHAALRMGLEVVVPGGVLLHPRRGRDQHPAVVKRHREQRDVAGLAALGAGAAQQNRVLANVGAHGRAELAVRPLHQTLVERIQHVQRGPAAGPRLQEPLGRTVIEAHGRQPIRAGGCLVWNS